MNDYNYMLSMLSKAYHIVELEQIDDEKWIAVQNETEVIVFHFVDDVFNDTYCPEEKTLDEFYENQFM